MLKAMLFRICLLAAVCAVPVAQAADNANRGEESNERSEQQTQRSEQIGTFDFPSSVSPEAEEHFLRGVGFLHSFGMTQARESFHKAQELDPDFALAYWGETFTYQHPFYGPVDERPGQALLKLGATAEERLAKAPTKREKGFLKAAEAYALAPGGMPERRRAWMAAMADLYEQYPDDDEVKAFYAVSMLSGATASGDMRAGSLALQLFKDNDNHPGAAHYVIHSFDDPLHAPIALEAALKYADIAPAVSHARHMPTHIFIQHGMWDRVAKWNDSAFQAARALWKPGDTVGDQNHSSDWGQYGDLQLGNLERSRLWIERAEQTLQENPGDARSINTLKNMQARHIIETEQWELRELSDDLAASELLALGLSAAHLGELALAEQVAEMLGARASDQPNNANLQVMHAEVAALALAKQAQQQLSEGLTTDGLPQGEQAIEMLASAIALKEAQRPPNGAADPLKPIHELTGEVLLVMGQPKDAAARFEQSLLRMPNRPLSLIGAARAYAAMNEKEKAAAKYRAYLAVRGGDDAHPAVLEAAMYVGG